MCWSNSSSIHHFNCDMSLNCTNRIVVRTLFSDYNSQKKSIIFSIINKKLKKKNN